MPLIISSTYCTELAHLKSNIALHYANLAHMNYLDASLGAKKLRASITSFLSDPKKESMSQAKRDWIISARTPYSQSEIFRFVNGPIDFEPINDGVTTFLESINFKSVEGLLNAWPLDEAYIDYVNGDPNSGIINQKETVINSQNLVLLNERGGDKNVATGFHAIEFLLWGQDQSLTSPGNRPLFDYTTHPSHQRRKKYLKTVTLLLESHINRVLNQWEPHQSNYRKELESLDPAEVLSMSLESIIAMLGDELKAERIENALLLEDQEEEQSCFSDTTINDIYYNYLGAKNLYMGFYTPTNQVLRPIYGPSLSDLVQKLAPKLNEKIIKTFSKFEKNIAQFYNVAWDELGPVPASIALPFDQAIQNEPQKIQDLVDTLELLEAHFEEVKTLLGL